MEGGYLDLERACLAAKGEAGQPVMALVEGAIALRPPMEGPSPVPTLVVGRFLRLEPGEACPARFRTARWRVPGRQLELNDAAGRLLARLQAVEAP